MAESSPSSPPDEFSRWVSDALSQLYDSAALQSHPLGKAAFPAEANPIRRCQALRKLLLDAIHSLEPGPGVPGDAPDRRLYRLVELRFIEGLDPNEAMSRLGLAKSQFYRDQARVLEILVETLWTQMPSVPENTAGQAPADPRSSLITAEVQRLAPDTEPALIDAASLASDIRQIVTPLADDHAVKIQDFDLSALDGKPLNRVLLRQALLTSLTAVLDLPGVCCLALTSRQETSGRTVTISVLVEDTAVRQDGGFLEEMEACRLLVEALGGRLQQIHSAREIRITLVWEDIRNRLLLVIDDNTGMADLFRLYLKGSGWQVLGASGGQEARSLLREHRPDLILLDILMPQEDGWELLRAIKTDETSQSIPVIICSVLKQPQIALKLGAAAYVEKPVSQQDLLNAVASIP